MLKSNASFRFNQPGGGAASAAVAGVEPLEADTGAAQAGHLMDRVPELGYPFLSALTLMRPIRAVLIHLDQRPVFC